jgi:hypothetical protein
MILIVHATSVRMWMYKNIYEHQRGYPTLHLRDKLNKHVSQRSDFNKEQ